MSDPTADYANRAHYLLRDRGTDHLVVLLHGLGGDHRQPLGLTADGLAGSGLSVLAPDARAHGDTPVIGAPDRFTAARMADDVVALINNLGLGGKQLIVVGISMGAAVALQLARQHPDRVRGALAIRPSFEIRPWPDHLLVFKEIASLLREQGPGAVESFQRAVSYQQMRAASPSAAASLLEQFTKPGAVERVVRLETVPGNVAIDWRNSLELASPLTVVAAAQDPGHPEYVAELWHERIPASVLMRVPSRDSERQAYAAALDQTTTNFVIQSSRSV